MAHTYDRDGFAYLGYAPNPVTPGQRIARALYVGAGDTVANIATALAASADAAKLLPKGSIVTIQSIEAASEAAGDYLVTANTGTSITLAAATWSVIAAATINPQTGTTYTLVIGDAGKIITATNASPVTVTVPANASVAFPIGTVIEVVTGGAGAVAITGAAGVTINGISAAHAVNLPAIGDRCKLLKIATNDWLALPQTATRAINAQTGTTYAPTLADIGKVVTCTNASAITVTIPANASVKFPVGTELMFIQGGAGAVTVAVTSDTLTGAAANLATSAIGDRINVVKTASTTWVATASQA